MGYGLKHIKRLTQEGLPFVSGRFNNNGKDVTLSVI